ncbi:hypothetical protein BBJ28_00018664 [Nothophytophthora sp. Chile5]|nr:hypothetical protein BBJ28_00018664 [Nothophytophthora sp. Chile5]
MVRVLNCIFFLAAFAVAATRATDVDDEISKLKSTLAELELMKAADTANSNALKFLETAAMASSSSGSSDSSATITADDSANSEYDIEPQPSRETPTPTVESASSSASASSASAEQEVTTPTPTTSAATVEKVMAPTAFAVASAIAYAML